MNFEKSLGITLPDDYKQFLLQNNGGYPSEELVFTLDDSQSVLSHFYTLGLPTDDILSLEECLKQFVVTRRIESNYLPIADDAFGNQLCLRLSGREHGQVYFWDHEANEGKMTKIADSFTSFCQSLKVLDE